jgi:hypothetical protein
MSAIAATVATDRTYEIAIGLVVLVAGVVLLARRRERQSFWERLMGRPRGTQSRAYRYGVYVAGPAFLIICGVLILVGAWLR